MNLRRLIPTLLVCLPLAACGVGSGDIEGLVGGGGKPITYPPPSTPPARTAEEIQLAQDVFDLVNAERTSHGVAPVVWSDSAALAAFGHAYDMAVRGYFEHDSPEGETPGDRLTRHGVSWSASGENIALGQQTPAAVMTSWMNSPGHRANILDPTFTRLGVGMFVATTGPNGPWWVQDFFRP